MEKLPKINIIYEDNHLLVVEKPVGIPVQEDSSKDIDMITILKEYRKKKENKTGNAYIGLVHRLDRPVGGVMVFAKTSKALERMNRMFADHQQIKKTYRAIVCGRPERVDGKIESYLLRVEKQNKSYSYSTAKPNSKFASLDYKTIACGDRYSVLEVELHTGRHHQIRCQLASIGCPIKGDLKYGAPRSNPDGGISLLARSIEFIHPVSKELIHVEAPLPKDALWGKLLSVD